MVWSGRPPSQAPHLYAAGITVVTTNANGDATIGFGRTFPGGVSVVATGGNGESVALLFTTGTITATTFTARFYDQAGTAIANGAVRCLWQAFPIT